MFGQMAQGNGSTLTAINGFNHISHRFQSDCFWANPGSSLHPGVLYR